MTIKLDNIYDLTADITENTIVYPNDPVFYRRKVSSINDTCSFNLVEIRMNNHMGTHIDFPAHVLKDGKMSNEYPLSYLIGNGVIIEIPSSFRSVTSSFLETQDIKENDFVFLKTSNSYISKQSPLIKDYVYIQIEAANLLLEKKVRIVGIDYISVDAYTAINLPVHHLFLLNNILIVENLELKNVPAGRCQIFIAPLNISGMDGLPARVIMIR